MTKEKLIRYGKDYLHDLEKACCSISDTHKEFVREAIKALEQRPSDCKIFGHKENCIGGADCENCDYKIQALEQPTSDDCVSRQAVRDAIMKCETMNEDSADGFIESTTELEAEIACLPPVTPKYHKSATNGEEIIRAFPNLKYTIQNGRVVTTIGVASSFDLDWWNAPYKRGNEE